MPAELARIKAGTDTCNDLNGFARGLPSRPALTARPDGGRDPAAMSGWNWRGWTRARPRPR
jgi:hypothetical protein